MEEGNRSPESSGIKSTGDRELDVSRIIIEAENDPNGPSARARKVMNELAKAGVSNWDAYCFAVEYIASMALVMEHTLPEARSLIRMLYLTYYVRFGDVSWLDSSSVSASPEKESVTTSGPLPDSSNISKE